jgi:dethiobiotin synthetase/adenosylmethionine--8-amino-7-oxononanoate aminotransferase
VDLGELGERATGVWSFWDPKFIERLSGLDSVKEVMTLGCVLAIKIDDGGRGKVQKSIGFLREAHALV